MATLNVTEYGDLARDSAGNLLPAGQEPSVASQNVTYTTSTASNAFSGRTRFVRVIADADAHLAFGSAPTATVASTRIEANVAEFFGVRPGDKVAAYDGSS